MEPGDTSGMALWNPVTRDWSDAVVEAIDPDDGVVASEQAMGEEAAQVPGGARDQNVEGVGAHADTLCDIRKLYQRLRRRRALSVGLSRCLLPAPKPPQSISGQRQMLVVAPV